MLIVLASLGLIRRHRPIDAENGADTSTGTVQFQYWASIGANTVLALPRWRSFSVWALASARTSIGIAAMAFISSMGTCQVPILGTFHYQQWQIFAAHTSEFYRTLEKLWIRK